MYKRARLISILLIISMCCSLFGTQPVNTGPTIKIDPYKKESETPSWLKNLRRAEIVSLGSLPFTTLSVSLGYSVIRGLGNGFATGFPNPFAKDKNNFSSDEQLGIFLTSLGISLLIGVTDYIVSSVKDKRNETQQNKEKAEENQAVILEVK